MRSLILMLLSFAAAAAADADYGFGLTVSVNWRLQLSSAEGHTLRPDSDAARQGVRNGDRIIAIEDCEIPGWSARRAEKLLNTSDSAARRFRLHRPDGESYSVSLKPSLADAPPVTDKPRRP